MKSLKKKHKDQVRTPMISKRLLFVETKKYKSSNDKFVLQR